MMALNKITEFYLLRYSSLIHGENLEDIVITGNWGKINGRGWVKLN